MKVKDLTNQRFGRLTVKSFVDVKNTNARWLCKCDCGNECIVYAYSLKQGKTQSCGCLHKEIISLSHKKFNTFKIMDTYVIGYTSNTNKPFYIDIDDYESIKDYCWYENDNGYIMARINNKHIRLHRFIMSCNDDVVIDHINNKREDNRKQNLRYATKQTNGINRGANKNNKLGIKGVNKNSNANTYTARIMVNGKSIYLGSFPTIALAKEAREKAEKEYFGEFAYAESEVINNE